MKHLSAQNVFFGLIIVFVTLFEATAADYFVNNNSLTGDVFCTATGSAGNNGLSASTPKATLTQVWNTYGPSGSNVITSGDVIYVDAGTYLATDNNLALSVNGISIVGAGMELTFFDNNNTSTDANRWAIITGDDISISNIYVTGYNYGFGDANAIQITGANNLTFTNVMVNENTPGGGSSAIVINGASSVTFIGGGASCNPGAASVAGGGVNVEGNGNTVSFTDYTLSANEKDYQGGSGLYILGDNTTSVTVMNSIFSDNINGSSSGGGAIFVANGAQLNISGSCFNNNQSSQVSSVNYGGAISVGRGSTATVSNCNFSGNFATSSGNGGAISINTGLGSAGTTATVNLSVCSFTGNTAVDGADILGRVSTSRAAVFNVNDCTWSGTSEDVTNDNSASMTLIFSGSPSTSGAVSSDGLAVRATPTLACPSTPAPCFSVLPVEFLDFAFSCEDDETKLNWSTASERNNDFFTIYYSKDYNSWEEVYARKGNGTTQTKSEYTVNLSNAEPGYYKLTQTDIDGRTAELKTVFANECSAGLKVISTTYNRQNGTIILNYSSDSDEKSTIQVVDNTGKLIHSADVYFLNGSNRLEIVVPRELSTGVYFVNSLSKSGSITNRCVVFR